MFEHHHLELLKSLTKNLRKKIPTMTTFLFGGKSSISMNQWGLMRSPKLAVKTILVGKTLT